MQQQSTDSKNEKKRWNKKIVSKKTIAMYFAMVAVSTGAIFLLEHASIFGAFRTALVAAIGKTFAANWVSGFFE